MDSLDWWRGGDISSKAATLQSYNLELAHRIEELREKRDDMKRVMQAEEEEKNTIQKELSAMTKRLTELDDSLQRKYTYCSEYDRTLHEVETAYSKILESSKALLQVLKTEPLAPNGPTKKMSMM